MPNSNNSHDALDREADNDFNQRLSRNIYENNNGDISKLSWKYVPGLLGKVQPIFQADSLDHLSDDGGLVWVGNPANRRLRKEWSRREGVDWPTDSKTGRNYDVAHIVARADNGKDHVDNIRPMHPDHHRAEHVANGDLARWGRRPGIARAFGGTVARSIEPLAVISGLLGLLSGRIRTNNFTNFAGDILGVPTPEDEAKAFEARQKLFNPNWKPGDPYST